MIPYQIERIVDRAGAVLEEGRPVPRDALRPDTAYIMVSLMRGVVQRGTGARARQLGWPVGGKTGTMDDYTDAWFVGFDPEITLGVWVGYDEKKTLGDGEEGARVALPIWLDFMRAYIDVHPSARGTGGRRRSTGDSRICARLRLVQRLSSVAAHPLAFLSSKTRPTLRIAAPFLTTW